MLPSLNPTPTHSVHSVHSVHSLQTKLTPYTSATLFALFVAFPTFAGTLVSNLDESTDSLRIVGNIGGTETRSAQSFTTGPNQLGYNLDSVTIDFGVTIGSPADIVIALYSRSLSDPGTRLATLTGSNPSTPNTYTFTTPVDVPLLSSETSYFVVMHADGSASGSMYGVQETVSTAQTSSDAWSIEDSSRSSNDGGTNWQTNNFPIRLSVQATPVPEPQQAFVASIPIFVGLILFQRHRRLKKETGSE